MKERYWETVLPQSVESRYGKTMRSNYWRRNIQCGRYGLGGLK